MSSSVTRTMLSTAARLGLEPERVLRQVGLDPERFSAEQDRLPVRMHIALFELAARVLQRPDLGLEVGRSFRPGTLQSVGYAAMNAPDLAGAWGCLARYWRLVAEGTRFELEVGDAEASLSFQRTDPTLPFPRFGCESVLTGQVAFARWLTHAPVRPVGVYLPFARPSYADELEAFFGAPVVYESPHAMTVWPRSVLTMPVVEADSALLELFDRRLQASLQALDATSESLIVADVRRVIVGRLSAGVPTIDEVAVELRTSRRSLQRRLAESGQTYQRVVDDTRCELTLRLLAEATMTIEDVAFMVGFSEASAFYRAFKRWKGTTPLQWRAASTPGQPR